MEAKQLAAAIAASLDKHKAEDLRVIGIGELSVIADYFVIATGTSSTQVKSLADYVETELKEQGVEPLRQEGYASSTWVLMDYGDVVVHIFTQLSPVLPQPFQVIEAPGLLGKDMDHHIAVIHQHPGLL